MNAELQSALADADSAKADLAAAYAAEADAAQAAQDAQRRAAAAMSARVADVATLDADRARLHMLIEQVYGSGRPADPTPATPPEPAPEPVNDLTA